MQNPPAKQIQDLDVANLKWKKSKIAHRQLLPAIEVAEMNGEDIEAPSLDASTSRRRVPLAEKKDLVRELRA